MKDYFKFNLKAQKLLSVWITFLVLFMVPYVYLIVRTKDFIDPHHPLSILGFYGIIILLLIIAYAIIFYLIKLTIEGVEFKGNQFEFEGTFGDFMGQLILGLFLTIITLGIYSPWFITRIHKFFVDNTSHDSNELNFEGSAGKLFKILFFTTFLPIMALMIGMIYVGFKGYHTNPTAYGMSTNLITFLILIPYMYYFYKWVVNVTYKAYTISWETSFWHSCGKILLEVFLSVITLGIYYPYAILRLYQYFVGKTFAVSETSKKGFGYDLEAREDFLFVWGQLLLTIITLGIYYPWAFCKVSSRILGKTYTQELAEEIA